MKNSKSIKAGLAIGIIFLFVLSSLTPMALGYTAESTEMDELLDNLRFMCTDENGFSEEKYEYYKEKLLSKYPSDNSNDDIVIELEEKELTIPVEPSSTPIISASGPKDTPWPMKCHDNHHTSQSPYSTIDTCEEKWKFYMEGWMECGSVIDNDGTIYFGGNYGGLPWYLYALYPDGTEKWKYKTGGLIWSTPAIAEDGTIYIGTYDHFLYAVNPDGTKKWTFLAGGNCITSSPAIAEDGTIYFGTMWFSGDGGIIYAVNPDGTEKWSYETGYDIMSDPAIGDDGTIYIGSCDTYLYAMNPDGTLKWRFKTGDWIKAHPSIGHDGTIYISSFDSYLYALYPNNGTMKWKRNSDYSGCSSVAIGEDGTLYFGSLNAAYPNNGTIKWHIDIPDISHSSLAISSDGIIYAGADKDIFAINPDGTERWHIKIANKWIESSPSIAEDGTVYIGCADTIDSGYFYAFGNGELEVDANGPYYGLINQPVQFRGSSSGGQKPYSYHWDFGDTHTSEEKNPSYTYTSPGNYDVVFTVTDNESNTATDTTFAWIQETNNPPDKPTINGPTNGNTGTSYDYVFSATELDGSALYLYIEWGDNSNTQWLGPYSSGEEVTKSHTWSSSGTFTIRCKAKDPYDEEGPWETLTVTMPRSKLLTSPLFMRLLERFPNAFPILRYLLEANS